MINRRSKASAVGRRGSIAIVVLVCLALVVMICAALIRIVQSERSVVRAEEYRAQGEWLVVSGLRRASARLEAKPDYDGESWKVPAEQLDGHDPAVVVIKVEPVKDHPDRRRVRVEASYPSVPARRVRTSRAIEIKAGVASEDGSK